MTVNHRLLYRVQFCGVFRQRLNRDEFLPIQRWQKLNTGVYGPCSHLIAIPAEFCENNSTGATITFGAALFAAGPLQVFAQELQHGTRRLRILDSDDFAVEYKADRLAGLHNGLAANFR